MFDLFNEYFGFGVLSFIFIVNSSSIFFYNQDNQKINL